MLIELDPVDRITADAVGPPGQRAFYLQGRSGTQVVTLLLEKQQVQLLAASVVEILARVGRETGQGPPEEEMGLETPVLPEWRAGRLSIGYQEDRDLVLLEVEEVAEDEAEQSQGELGGEEQDQDDEETGGESLRTRAFFDLRETFGQSAEPEEVAEEEAQEEPEPDPDGEANRVRFWATREQMLSLARHGASVCARGRPRCPLCGNPIDPDGHRCPALNGHHQPGDA